MYFLSSGNVAVIAPDNKTVLATLTNGAFFGESMFHRVRDVSKLALYYLVEKLKQSHFSLFEVQFLTPHLSSLGAVEISDPEYMQRLSHALNQKTVWNK